jgi:hypothetical protein
MMEDGKRERKKQKIDVASAAEGGQHGKEKGKKRAQNNENERESAREREAELKKRQNGANYPNTKELIFGPILEDIFNKVNCVSRGAKLLSRIVCPFFLFYPTLYGVRTVWHSYFHSKLG